MENRLHFTCINVVGNVVGRLRSVSLLLSSRRQNLIVYASEKTLVRKALWKYVTEHRV